MDRRNGNQPNQDNLKKQKKYAWYVCKYSKILPSVHYNKRESNKIVTLGPNKVSLSL